MLSEIAHHEPRTFKLPAIPDAAQWTLRIDTHLGTGKPALAKTLPPDAMLWLESRSMMLFESPPALSEPILTTAKEVLVKSTKRRRKKGLVE